ncbi:hypothetical protein BT69DRAFT_945245 [Atractiella rhizophila]|nr:hypothetical protein BT69DRAFT_945245 [Atractiella rhizophila]
MESQPQTHFPSSPPNDVKHITKDFYSLLPSYAESYLQHTGVVDEEAVSVDDDGEDRGDQDLAMALGGFSTKVDDSAAVDTLDLLVARSSSLLRLSRSALMSTLECREQLDRFNVLYASMESTFDHSEREIRRRSQQHNRLDRIIRDVESSLDGLIQDRHSTTLTNTNMVPPRLSRLRSASNRPVPPRPKTLYLNASVVFQDDQDLSPSPSRQIPSVLGHNRYSPSASSASFSLSSWDSDTFASAAQAQPDSKPNRSAKQLLTSLNQKNPPADSARTPPAARDLLLRIRAASPGKGKGKERDQRESESGWVPTVSPETLLEKPRRRSMPTSSNPAWSSAPPVPALPADSRRMDASGGRGT